MGGDLKKNKVQMLDTTSSSCDRFQLSALVYFLCKDILRY